MNLHFSGARGPKVKDGRNCGEKYNCRWRSCHFYPAYAASLPVGRIDKAGNAVGFLTIS
jgi:hypothetical protein